MKLYIYPLTLLFILSACNFSGSLETDLPEGYYDRTIPSGVDINENPDSDIFQNYLEGYVQKGLPGAIMLINNADGLWVGSAGKCDIYRDVDMHPFTLSRIGSTTKMFMAVTILILVEENFLDLDDTISQYLPAEIAENLDNAESATVKQLLNHTSGIVNDTDESENALEWLFNAPGTSLSYEDLIKTAYGKPAYFEPGEGWHYSNTGYNLLAYIIESVTGEEHWKILETKIFNPIGLDSTFYNPGNRIPPGTARGYFDMYGNGTIYETTDYDTLNFCPAGAIVSTAYDLMLFITNVFNGTLINSSSLVSLMSTVPMEPGITDKMKMDTAGYGLGVIKWDTPHGFAYGHGGETWGYRAELYYFPDYDTTIALLVNGAMGNIGEQIIEMRNNLPDLIF